MLRADTRVDGVKFCVPAKLVCRGVPSGVVLTLMTWGVPGASPAGWAAEGAEDAAGGSDLLPSAGAAWGLLGMSVCFL